MIKAPVSAFRNFSKIAATASINGTFTPLILFSTRIGSLGFRRTQKFTFTPAFSFGSNKVDSQFQNVEKGQFTGPGFYVQQMMTSCLAIYSYYIESGNECFLIDPMNETQKYEQIIKARGKTLKGVFLTHYHADYIAGHLELKKKYNAQIYLGPKALSTFGIKVLKDNQDIKVGDIKLRVIHTPGHTQESSCLILIDSKGKQQCIFTGDTLFLNEVGRPDLAVKTDLSAKDLGGMLFDSLQKIKSLKDDIRVYPGHGAGSACGKSIGKGDFCTLGTQKQNNYGLKQSNKAKFVEDLLHQMPKPPQYFGYNAGINKFKPFDYDEAHQSTMKKLSVAQVQQLIKKQKATIIDIRSKDAVKTGMIKDSVAIDFDGAFANWVGTILPPEGGNYIIYGSQDKATEAIKRLLRIGYHTVRGYFTEDAKSLPKQFGVYTPDFVDFVSTVKNQKRTVLDVRKPDEWKKGVVEGDVTKLQLSKIQADHSKTLDKSKKYIIHCQGGYRARIAYSLLKPLGYDVKCYADGGYGNFQKMGVKTVKPQ